MAYYGQQARNRPALYKPTDFSSQQKRAPSISDELKKEEEPPVIKIQQRPASTVEAKEENNKGALPTKPSSKDQEEMPETDKQCTEKLVGVAEKDLEKIQKLKEFMAKQQNGTSTKENTKEGKDNKGPHDGKTKKDAASKSGKDEKENKDDKTHRPASNRHHRNANRGQSRNKPNSSNRTEASKDNKKPTASNPDKVKSDNKKDFDVSGGSGGARPRNKPSKGPKQTSENYGQHNNQQHPNSYYTQSGFSGRGPPPMDPNWLHMQFQSGQVANSQGILRNPYSLDSQDPGQIYAAKRTVPATKDKTEQKRSLDFVKNFFQNDPEVQHNRKQNAEKRAVKNAPLTAQTVPVKPLTNSGEISSAQQAVYNSPHLIEDRSISLNQTNVNMQALMSQHNANLASGLPTSYSSVYHQHSNVSHGGMAPGVSHGTVHHSASPVSMNQTNTSAAALHAFNHPSSMFQHQGVSSYSGMYSQMGTHGAPGLLSSSNYHDNLHGSNLSSSGGMSSLQSYSGYFPTNHQGHIRHVQQHLNPSVMQNILLDPMENPKKWQEKALTKCGPIDSSQARSLIEQLINGSYECMVCCESVKWSNQVWNCSNCFHIFHLSCIRKWARSEAAAVKEESGWRCPGCQNVSTRPPNKYFCFCGKVRDPDWTPKDGITPHSCGEVCKKKRVNPPCEHSCNELCHPGPCPSCPVMVSKHCPCGKSLTKLRCGQPNLIKCENTCSKLLKCGQHHCQLKCHQGPCETCDVQYNEECFCGKQRRVVNCETGEILPAEKDSFDGEYKTNFSCAEPCDRDLTCKNHKCEASCHSGACKDCPLLPTNVQFCPCGKVPVTQLSEEERNTCLDPIPTCDSFCGKKLKCGPKGSSHLCMMRCHTGKCKPCEKITNVKCRCTAIKKDILCKDVKPDEPILCERKCNKKRKCGRHKCNQKCCTDKEHSCNIICGKKLSCGTHKCDEVCHIGFCPPCWRAGFDELSCHCGATVIYPPIACGTKPPECSQPCNRAHHCGHQPLHPCHNEDSCPPCTFLTTKQCMGGHEIWKNVPCHLTEVSCGRKCGKLLPCQLHKCIKTCHKGPCIAGGEVCTQPCPIKRKDCAHDCGAICHSGKDCPATPCKAQVNITCRCGRKSASAFCLAGTVNSAYQSFNAEMLTSQLHNLQTGHSIDISRITNADKRPKFLDCDEECSRLERNKRLAEALGIENPDGNQFQHTAFSPQLKQEAKSQYSFIQMLETVLDRLVMNAKKSSQSQIHHPFPPMNASQRKIVHELAEAYNCKTYSQDSEPKRNTVVIATKDSYIPNVKLSTIVDREIMKSNPPPPVMLTQEGNVMFLGSTKPIKPMQSQPSTRVDYFDDDYPQ